MEAPILERVESWPRQGRYPTEVREQAVHVVFARQGEHATQWTAITSIAEMFDVSHETLRLWVQA